MKRKLTLLAAALALACTLAWAGSASAHPVFVGDAAYRTRGVTVSVTRAYAPPVFVQPAPLVTHTFASPYYEVYRPAVFPRVYSWSHGFGHHYLPHYSFGVVQQDPQPAVIVAPSYKGFRQPTLEERVRTLEEKLLKEVPPGK